MFLLFIVLVRCEDPYLRLEDIAFIVWSGYECISNRVYELSKTWFNLVPEVHVYTDFIPEGIVEKIEAECPNCNLIFHEMGFRGDYLVGSDFDNPYNHAQSRHLLTMVDIYESYPKKKWYFFCDDDAYVFPIKLLEFLQTKPGDLFGQSFYFIQETYRFFPSTDPTRTFLHGGPGVAYSNKIMENLVPNISMCQNIYSVSKMGSDIKISGCFALIHGLQWYKRPISFLPIGYFCSNTPDHMIRYDRISDETMTYHTVQPNHTPVIWRSHASSWKDRTNTTLLSNWESISTLESRTEIGGPGRFMRFNFGFSIKYGNSQFHATSSPVPIFDEDDVDHDEPLLYEQTFESGIVLQYICDSSIDKGDFAIMGFLNDGRFGSKISVKCPRPQRMPYSRKHGEHIIIKQIVPDYL